MSATANIAARLAETIGAARVVTAELELPTYAIDGLVPSAIVRPACAAEVAQVVGFVLAEKLSIVPLGSRSKCDLGMAPSKYDIAIDMTALRDVAHYDAGDLTLSIDAGMPLRELAAFLKAHGQFLPLAVPCFGCTTAGGTVASGIDSVLRAQYGTPRDFLIGAEFVDGTGKLCRSGGRVVKNVTGYDLHKLLVGSLGTLAIITRLNFRTFPLPTVRGGHLASFADCETALAYREAVDNSGLPVANLEILSPGAATRIRKNIATIEAIEPDRWHVAAAFEGNEHVVRRIAGDLQRLGHNAGSRRNELLDETASEKLQAVLREAFDWLRHSSPTVMVSRIVAPDICADTLLEFERLAGSASLQSAILVRAASVVYFAVFAGDSDVETTAASLASLAAAIKRLAVQHNGHAAILHAPVAVKARMVTNRGEQHGISLDARVKQAFDPSGIFATGRIVGGL